MEVTLLCGYNINTSNTVRNYAALVNGIIDSPPRSVTAQHKDPKATKECLEWKRHSLPQRRNVFQPVMQYLIADSEIIYM